MHRLLLSLWLLGAALFAGSMLVAMNVIFGWSSSKPGTDRPVNAARNSGDAESRPGIEPCGVQPAVPVYQEAPLQPRVATRSAPVEQAQAAAGPDRAVGAMATGSQDDDAWVRVRRGANLRAGSWSSASRLSNLPAGTELRAVAREKGWVQVAGADGSLTGWVYEKLLEPIASPPSQIAEPAGAEAQGEAVRVGERAAIVRAGPSEDVAMLFGFPYGRELRVLSRQPGWVEIVDVASKQTGWIAESSLQTAVASRRKNRGAPYANAGYSSGAQAGLLPWDETMGERNASEQPRKRWRKAGSRRNSVFSQAIRRAFGSL